MSAKFEKDLDKDQVARIEALVGKVAAYDPRLLLFEKLKELKSKEMCSLARSIGQPISIEINNIGDIKTMSDGRKYKLTEKGWELQ